MEEFFILEQGSISVTECKMKFFELVRIVPFISEDEEQRCKRFMAGLNPSLTIVGSLNVLWRVSEGCAEVREKYNSRCST